MARKVLDTAKISTKSQLVLPRTVREKLHVQEGDILVFADEDGKVTVEKLR